MANEAKQVRDRLTRLERNGSAPPDARGELWDRVAWLAARHSAVESALERLSADHECTNPTGKGPRPCAVCSMSAELIAPDPPPALPGVSAHIEHAAATLAERRAAPTDEIETLFGAGALELDPAAAPHLHVDESRRKRPKR
jgi:hypothetical protein